jgi:hypothetical protein
MKRNRIGKSIMAAALILVGTIFVSRPAKAETHFSIGIGVAPGYGYYAPPPVVYRPPYPGPGYYWTDGYYNPYGTWIAGYWAPRAYIAPRYYGGAYYGGNYRRDFDRDDHRRYDRDDFRGRGNAFGRRR